MDPCPHPHMGPKKSDPIGWKPPTAVVLLFHRLLVLAFPLVTNGDSGSEIFGARCSGVASVGAWSDRVASGRAFAVILVAIIDDCSDFGLELLRLGFGLPTSAASSVFAVQKMVALAAR
jgi:hypothetical protein